MYRKIEPEPQNTPDELARPGIEAQHANPRASVTRSEWPAMASLPSEDTAGMPRRPTVWTNVATMAYFLPGRPRRSGKRGKSLWKESPFHSPRKHLAKHLDMGVHRARGAVHSATLLADAKVSAGDTLHRYVVCLHSGI